MEPGLTISVVDPDDDYLGVEIVAASHRFAGTTRVYAGLKQLGEFARLVAGFPQASDDIRTFEFGHRERAAAGGFVQLSFITPSSGPQILRVAIEDDPVRHAESCAEFQFRFEASELDRFLAALVKMEQDRDGSAVLRASDV